jgi:hypothetical protein
MTMKTEQILIANQKIAEYMGAKITYDGNTILPVARFEESPAYEEEVLVYELQELGYRVSWNWLMPVLTKIYESDEYFTYKNESASQFHDGSIEINTKFIETTWEQVVEFMQYYFVKLDLSDSSAWYDYATEEKMIDLSDLAGTYTPDEAKKVSEEIANRIKNAKGNE